LTAGLVVYNTKMRRADVTGNATVVEDKKRVRADRFVAFFKDEKDKNSLRLVEAFGNVVITTQTEIARGDRGDYNAETQIATLTGNVRLTRGDNQLNGDRAEVNMKTGVSKLLAAPGEAPRVATNPGEGRRVRVLLMPGSTPDSGKGPLDIPGAGTDNKKNSRTETKPRR
jgi:lipopolysaccharide export system protein LptA